MTTVWITLPLEELYLEPSRNGLNRPKRVRGSGFKMVNMGELFTFDRIGNPPMERVKMTEAETDKFALKPGDLLFARQSLVLEGAGKCSIVLATSETTTFESHLIRVRLDQTKCDPLFYYHYFKSPIGNAGIRSLVNQVAAAGIRGSELAKLRVLHPPLQTQHKITAVLSAYDDLIENNTRRIQILEEMAQALYREWFVHFRFPGHETSGMVESDMGLIPEGWQAVPSTTSIAFNPQTRVEKDGNKPFVPMGSVSESSMLIEDIETRTGNSGAKFKNGDTLFARITPCLENGKTAYVQFLPTDRDVAFGSTEFIVMRSRSLCPEFVYLLARSPKFRDNAIKSMSGATGRQRVQEAAFSRFMIAQPDGQVIQDFSKVVRPMFGSINNLSIRNMCLRQTRDLLLPKLISGEVNVAELDIPLREATP